MTSKSEVQELLRFLAQDAKIPLSLAMKAVPKLQIQHLTSVVSLAGSKAEALAPVFEDAKSSRQVINAAKRVQKKRDAPAEDGEVKPTVAKKPRYAQAHEQTPAELEESLSLPVNEASKEELEACVLKTNRAPLMVAFVVQLLKYTMPEQPLSSRLSLAHAVMSTNARSKAISIGLESGASAEDDGWGQGQPVIKIMGRELRVMKRHGYEWRPTVTSVDEQVKVEDDGSSKGFSQSTVKAEDDDTKDVPQQSFDATQPSQLDEPPPLWAIDLEALKRRAEREMPGACVPLSHNLPIYTPQAARDYLAKSFERVNDAKATNIGDTSQPKKTPFRTAAAEKLRNLGMLLEAIDQVYASWSPTIDAEELDRRSWPWYARVRPAVADGAAGWGGKGQIKLSDILALKRSP